MYVDGFLLPIPKKNRDKYLKMARLAGKVWKDHGALAYVEAEADDVKPGKWTSFPQAVKLKKGETVWFSYAVYKNPRLQSSMDPKKMPFDGKRMMWGGFKVAVGL